MHGVGGNLREAITLRSCSEESKGQLVMLAGPRPRLSLGSSEDCMRHGNHQRRYPYVLRDSMGSRRPSACRCTGFRTLHVGEFMSLPLSCTCMACPETFWRTSFLRRIICSMAKGLPKMMQAESAVGLIEVAHLDAADLDAASVVLVRSFATSPDSVSVSLKDVG